VRRVLGRLSLALVSAAVFFAAAEGLYRWLGPTQVGKHYWQNAEREEVPETDPRAVAYLQKVEPAPRFRLNFKPGTKLYLCYRNWRQPWLDERGCVPYGYNSCGIRDREEVCQKKPPGQRRVVCIGDSMTVGWGLRLRDNWTARVERLLRERDDRIRTVNCGASGTFYVDEYSAGLRHRFWRFEPDVVLVSLCLNDLLPINGGMGHYRPDAVGRPWWASTSRLLGDLTRLRHAARALELDPSRDWVQELMDLPEGRYPQGAREVGRAALWPGGGPQDALREIRDFCAERGVACGVVIWPLFQGLGPGAHYPFTRMHEIVRDFCREEAIEVLDLLPTFRGEEATSLWVSPADMHGNPRAQDLAAAPIAAFAGRLLGS
jgi:hypothetical protein